MPSPLDMTRIPDAEHKFQLDPFYFESVDSFLKKWAVMGFGTCVIATRTRKQIAPAHPIHQFSGLAAKRQVDKSHKRTCIGPPNLT